MPERPEGRHSATGPDRASTTPGFPATSCQLLAQAPYEQDENTVQELTRAAQRHRVKLARRLQVESDAPLLRLESLCATVMPVWPTARRSLNGDPASRPGK